MIFNGHDFSSFLRVNPQRPIMPPMEVETVAIPGRRGSTFRSARLGEMMLPVSARLIAPAKSDTVEVRRQLAAMLHAAAPSKLVLPDDPTRYLMAVIDGSTDLSTLWRTGSTTLNFRCPDPVAYGSEESSSMTTSASPLVGGTYETNPIITAKPATGSYYRLTLVDTGEYVQVNASFTGAQTLVVDMDKQHCTINGASADPYVVLSSDYFALKPGINKLSANSGSAVVRWVERWV